MKTIKKSPDIIIKGADNWQPVLLNLMKRAGIHPDTLTFKRRGQSMLWLFSSKSRPYRIIYHLSACSAIFCALARLRSKRIINHWIGSEVRRYHGRKTIAKRISAWIQERFVDLQLVDSEIIQEELRAIGINSELVRLLPKTISGNVSPLPRQPTVLSYWMDSRFNFYGGPVVIDLAKAFPEAKFLIARATGEGLTDIPDNLEFLGLVDNMPEIYRKSTCLIRMPQHDGLSAMVLEAMAYGRYVIYNHRCPFTSFAKDFDSARVALQKVLYKEKPNYEGADYVKKNFSIEGEARRLRELMENSFGSV